MREEPTEPGIARAAVAVAGEIVERYGRNPDFIVPMLQDLQHSLGYVPQEPAEEMARLLGVPVSQLYAVATFYRSFSLEPRGKHVITLCTGTVCYLKGARRLAEVIQSALEVKPGGTTADRLFTFQPVNCLGACALAPVMVIDDRYFEKVKADRVPDILAEYRSLDHSR